MAQLHLNKLNGAGNSFLIADLVSPQYKKTNAQAFKKTSRVQWAKQLCDIHWGIGADGFIVLEKASKNTSKSNTEQNDVTWDFYNADGSRAEMCGNAARCVGHYLATVNSGKKTIKKKSGPNSVDATMSSFLIKTKAGQIRSQVIQLSKNKLEAQVDVTMTTIHELELGLKTLKTSKAQTADFDFVNSGVPHAVVTYPALKKFFQKKFKDEKIYSEMADIVKKIRNEKRFLKAGTNVTFLTSVAPRKILSLTFERGVPSYTLACGTGAVAAAVSFLNGAQGNTYVQVPGGNLQVLIQGITPRLIGPSEHMAEFIVTV